MKKGEVDKLTQDVRDAEKAGYGIHYGNYKAAQKEKRDRLEAAARRAEADRAAAVNPNGR